MCPPFCNPPVQQPTRISMETALQVTEEETIQILTLRPPLQDLRPPFQDLSLANDDTLMSMAGGISFAPAANGAVTDDNTEDVDIQVEALPVLSSSISIPNVPPSRQSSSVPVAPSVHNGKAPRSMFGPRAEKAPDVSERAIGTAAVQFSNVLDMTDVHLADWANEVLGGDEASLPRAIVWRLHLSKFVLKRKHLEGSEAERKRLLGVRESLRSFLFVDINGTYFIGLLAPASRAYVTNDGVSILRLKNVKGDDIVANETRTLPVDPNRVRYKCHLHMHYPILLYPQHFPLSAYPYLPLPSLVTLPLSLSKFRS